MPAATKSTRWDPALCPSVNPRVKTDEPDSANALSTVGLPIPQLIRANPTTATVSQLARSTTRATGSERARMRSLDG